MIISFEDNSFRSYNTFIAFLETAFRVWNARNGTRKTKLAALATSRTTNADGRSRLRAVSRGSGWKWKHVSFKRIEYFVLKMENSFISFESSNICSFKEKILPQRIFISQKSSHTLEYISSIYLKFSSGYQFIHFFPKVPISFFGMWYIYSKYYHK